MQSADTLDVILKHFISPGLFIMTLLGALVVLLHLCLSNLDFLDRLTDRQTDRQIDRGHWDTAYNSLVDYLILKWFVGGV